MNEADRKMLFETKEATFNTFTDVNGKTKAGFFLGDFPAELFCEWERECEERYNGMRWLKAWCDHLVANNRDAERNKIVDEVLAILFEQQEAEKQEKAKAREPETDKPVSTLTGKYR